MGPTREFVSLFSKELQNRVYHFWNDSSESPYLSVSSPSFPPPSLPSTVGLVICRCGEWVFEHCPTHHCLLCFDSAGIWTCEEKDYTLSPSSVLCPKCNNSLGFCLQLR